MMTLWKSLILSEHDYCCQLWNPHRRGEIQALESLQHSFMKKINGLYHLSYWEQLEKLKLYSLERRRERHIVIYIWKILEGQAPNIASDHSAISAVWHPRRGRECTVPRVSTSAPIRIQSIRRASFAIKGPQIFNSLPRYVRNTTSCDRNVFKAQLDHYLHRVPDQPLLPGYTAYRPRCVQQGRVSANPGHYHVTHVTFISNTGRPHVIKSAIVDWLRPWSLIMGDNK